MRLRAAVLAALVATAAIACADDDAKFVVKYAPGFTKGGSTPSVFGVFRDGRLSPEAWHDIAPRFSGVLHKDMCEVAIGESLRASNPKLFAAIDDVARADGITDELLDKLAPAATGDSILVITIAGRPPKARHGSSAATTTTTTMASIRGGPRGPRAHGGGRHPATNVLDVSASLFSPRQHQSVALVQMTYTGASADEAFTKFVEELAASLPGATCAGWNPDVHVDDDAIRRLLEAP